MPAPWETPAAAAATVDGPPWEAQAERPPWESEPAAAELPSLKDEVASGRYRILQPAEAPTRNAQGLVTTPLELPVPGARRSIGGGEPEMPAAPAQTPAAGPLLVAGARKAAALGRDPEALNRALFTSLYDYLPADMRRAISPAEYLQEVTAKNPSDKFMDVVSGAANGLGDLGKAFVSPVGMAMLGSGNLSKAGQKVVGLAFAAQMAAQNPEIGTQLGEEMGKPAEQRDLAKITQLTVEGLGNSTIAGLAASHGLGVMRPPAEVKAPRGEPISGRVLDVTTPKVIPVDVPPWEAVQTAGREEGMPIVQTPSGQLETAPPSGQGPVEKAAPESIVNVKETGAGAEKAETATSPRPSPPEVEREKAAAVPPWDAEALQAAMTFNPAARGATESEVPNAIAKVSEQSGVQPQRAGGDEGGAAAEAGGGDRVQRAAPGETPQTAAGPVVPAGAVETKAPAGTGGDVTVQQQSTAPGPTGTEGKIPPPVRTRPQKVATPAPLAGTPAPPVNPVRQFLTIQATGVKSVTAPQALSPGARMVGNALRHFMGQNALALARADEAMHSFRKEFDRTPVPASWRYDPNQPLPHNYAIIDALERDPSQLPARYQALAATFQEEFAWRIAEIQKYAPNALQHLITNYFPHIWQDPARAGDAMAQVATRLFAGRKEFLKERSLAFFREGLERGLKPISDNPVDLLIAKMHSMDKFLLALRATDEFKAAGAMKFKYIFERLPDGWQIVDDPAFIVQHPPTVEITEAYDAYQRAKLGEALQSLGVSYKRVASLGGSRWAEADRGMREVRAQAGATEDMLWHELGHHADWQFPELRAALDLRGQTPMARQLRALADLRGEGQQVTAYRQKYFRSDQEKMAEIFRAYVHAPDLFAKTAPEVLRVVSQWLDTQPRLRDTLNEMRRGRLAVGEETTTKTLGGMQVLGHWIMPDGPAGVLRNYLSPGLQRFAAFRTFKAASNILNAAQLGLSAFHVGFTSLDAATSRFAIGLEDLAQGKPIRAARTWASVPISPITNIMRGARMRQEALHPGTTDAETAQLVKMLEQAGGRIGQDRFWQTDFARRMKRAFNEGTATGYLKGTLQAPFAAVEQAMRPIMEYVVPRQKLGVFADMARRELERLGPNASLDDTREAMRKAWDSVDNRMGQVVYDNLFYNRAIKDLALLSFRAYGWQLGKYREGFGAVADAARAAGAVAKGERPELSHRMAYAASLPVMVGLIGGTLNYLMTGQRPQDWRDYFMPRTGQKDVNGNAARLNLPSYMKDVLAYSRHPLISVQHSLNPMFSAIGDLLENKDFYNVQIRNPDDPLWRQGGAVAQFAAKQFVPFSLSGTIKLHEQATPIQKEILPYFGITPVPMRMTMTPAQELASEITGANMPGAPRTPEQFDRSTLIRQVAEDIRNGAKEKARTEAQQGFQAGKLNEKAFQVIVDKLKYTPLQFQVLHMDVPAAMRVWRVANPGERAQLTPLITTKLGTQIELLEKNKSSLTADEIRAYGAEIRRR